MLDYCIPSTAIGVDVQLDADAANAELVRSTNFCLIADLYLQRGNFDLLWMRQSHLHSPMVGNCALADRGSMRGADMDMRECDDGQSGKHRSLDCEVGF